MPTFRGLYRESLRISVDPERLTRVLLLLTAGLTAASTICQFLRFRLGYGRMFGLYRLFDAHSEANLPTFFSVLLLLACAAALFATGASSDWKDRHGKPLWTLLGIIFLMLATDEFVSIHERFNLVVDRLMPHGGLFFFGWVVAGIVFVIGMAVVFTPWL